MQSSHPQNEQEQPFGNWLEKARRKYDGAQIHNSGQFAVIVFDHKNIYLFADSIAATEFASKYPKHRIDDLALEPVRNVNPGFSNINSLVEADDRRQERREARERQRAAQALA